MTTIMPRKNVFRMVKSSNLLAADSSANLKGHPDFSRLFAIPDGSLTTSLENGTVGQFYVSSCQDHAGIAPKTRTSRPRCMRYSMLRVYVPTDSTDKHVDSLLNLPMHIRFQTLLNRILLSHRLRTLWHPTAISGTH